MEHSSLQYLLSLPSRSYVPQPQTRKPKLLTITIVTAILGLTTVVITFIAEFFGLMDVLVG